MSILETIEEWAEEQVEQSHGDRLAHLEHLQAKIQHLKDTGQIPDRFPPGDLKRSLAEAQLRKVEREAETLGFVRPAQEVFIEAGKEVARSHLGGPTGGISAEEDTEQKQQKKRAGPSLECGPELVPWS